MIQAIAEILKNNREWVFSGIGVTAIVTLFMFLRFVYRKIKNEKITLIISQVGNDLVVHNDSKATVEIDSVVYELYDITVQQDLSRPKRFSRRVGWPLTSGERKSIITIDNVFIGEIENFTAKDKELWSKQEPNHAFPICVGLKIWLNCNLAGKPILKQEHFRMIIGGFFGSRISILRNPYHFEDQAPLWLKALIAGKSIPSLLKNPIRHLKDRSQRRLIQAKLSAQGVARAHYHGVIDSHEAESRLQKIRNRLSKKQKIQFDSDLSSDDKSS
jgi:hypothetical protein